MYDFVEDHLKVLMTVLLIHPAGFVPTVLNPTILLAFLPTVCTLR